MSMSAKLRRAPLRIASGAYILNSGVGKLSADDETAKRLQSTATMTYPFLDKVQPKIFATGLGAAEVAVGGALLLPIVPPIVAGAALVGFSGVLLNMYWNTPGMHEEGSPRPTKQGMPIAKDVWMMGIGLGLMADAALEPAHDKVVELEASVAQKRAEKSRRARRKAKRADRRANTEYLKQVRENAVELQAEAAKRALKAAKIARERAELASEVAAARLAEARAEYAPVAAEKARALREAARQAAQEYGPVAAEKARAARDAARELAEEYRPVAEQKAKVARKAAKEYSAKAQKATAKARERIAS